MLDFPRWKVWLVILATLTGILAWLCLPCCRQAQRKALPGWWQESHINLGLDLSGGSQLLLEADVADVKKQQIEQMEETIRTAKCAALSPRSTLAKFQPPKASWSSWCAMPSKLDTAVELARKETAGVGLTGQKDWDVKVEDQLSGGDDADRSGHHQPGERADGNRAQRRGASVSTLMAPRKPTVIRQGTDRILVQVPGLQDPEGAEANCSARLQSLNSSWSI